MQTIPFSDARNRLKEVLDRVAQDADYTIITRRDAEADAPRRRQRLRAGRREPQSPTSPLRIA